jgi:hypothetical protein
MFFQKEEKTYLIQKKICPVHRRPWYNSQDKLCRSARGVGCQPPPYHTLCESV